MAVNWQSQYRTVPTDLTAASDPCSVAHVWLYEQSLNAAIVALSPKLMSIASPVFTSETDSATNERVAIVLGPWFVAPCYDTLTAHLGHYRSAGSGSVDWVMYSSASKYAATTAAHSTLDANLLGAYDSSALATTSSGTHAIAASVRATDILRDTAGYTWITVTTEADDASTAARLTTLDVTAQFSGAYV